MPSAIAYDRLSTEQVGSHRHLAAMKIPNLLAAINREDARAVAAVRSQQPAIASAVSLISSSLRSRGRLFLIGAGTSGRLSVLEAAECPPTFNTPPSLIQAIMAGGRASVFRSREGAEDNAADGERRIRARVRRSDVVVGITASGVTPFVGAALQAARRLGARTILVSCNARSPLAADVRILLRTGPEVLAGSTRLKAGTATKLVLNMLTLGSMVQLGKTYDNLMVDVKPTSKKLEARARRLVRQLTGASPARSAVLLRAARGRVKAAVVMEKLGLGYPAAVRRLASAQGILEDVLYDNRRAR